MKNIFVPMVLLIGLLISCRQTEKEKSTSIPDKALNEITIYTKDSIQIFGDLYEINKTAPTILLFHQGGSNARAEYQSIIPILEKNGFNILAIDQRKGGQIYGNYNRTVANIPIDEFEYCDAYADLESALDYILNSGFTGKKILWGSSYSGSLAIKLANQYQSDINGVLAFSPASGGPMQACKPDEYFKTLKNPLLVLRPSQEMEIESSKNQFELAKENNHEVYIADYGTHGSSMLVEERVGHKVDQNWNAVLSFLNKIKEN